MNGQDDLKYKNVRQTGFDNFLMRLPIMLLLVLLLSAVAYGAETTKLGIVYTGSLDGELEPCGCSPKTDVGGLARVASFLSGQAEELTPYILVDAGNFTDQDTPQGRLKAEAMLKSFSLMKYDAVALSGREKSFKDDLIPAMAKEHMVPAISNLPGVGKSIQVIRGDLKINISVDPGDLKDGRLNVLLADFSSSEPGLAEGWDIVILSSGEELYEPVRVNGTPIVAGCPEGKKLGVLTVLVDGTGRVSEYRHRWVTLGDDIDDDVSVRNVLDDYDMKVARLLQDAERPLLAETTYLGEENCAKCHQPFVESWKETRHAEAFLSLQKAGKSADPECLQCHTVGLGEDGGFFSIETTPELADVQCEACHGPGKEHLSDFSIPMKPVAETTCLVCHTKSRSPDFNYPAYREMIKH